AMAAIIRNIFITVFIVEFIIENLLNGFIALVNCLDWVQRRKISPVDQIITALTVSRVAQFWLIVNFSNSFFLYLKWRVRKVVSLTLILSLALLFLNITIINSQIGVWIDGNGRNLSFHFNLRNSPLFLKQTVFINSIFSIIPFAMSLVAFFLLMFSLWKHEKRMPHTARGPRDANTTAHIKALQTGIAFLSLYAIFLLLLVINIFSIELKENYIMFFRLFIIIAFSSCQSFVLILGNTKLRKASFSVLWWL
ncbi:hypothetical protein A6R68_04119, partial [Neotoma lepida]